MLSSKVIIEDYLRKNDWRVKDNSNAPFSFGALGKYTLAEVNKDYWLREVYTKDITDAYREGWMHLHDLGGLTIYCCGYSLRKVLEMGVQGVPNIPTSKPAKHFGAVLNQLANLTTVFQNEIMGAVAFSSFDTLLAPFVKADNLTYKEVYQHMQNWVFSINSNSRGGAEPAFSNVTFDMTMPKDLIDKPAIVGGVEVDFNYRACQDEMNMINKAFFEIMIAGDGIGQPFAYPIPTYNIHKRFDWDNPNTNLLWEMAGKYGTPYFANFINSDMEPEDARSMCCRLRLDKRELLKRNGGLFGSGDSTGSIGVVTLNLPRIGYVAADIEEALELIDHYMDLAKDSLEIKRQFCQEEVLDAGLIPAFATYIGTLKNHFSTIGYVGLNEFCMNLLGADILDEKSVEVSELVLNHMRERLSDYQEETGNLYNLEATPAESTCYSLALKDKRTYADIYTQGTDEAPYYTNSCHIPVKQVKNFKQVITHQDKLQKLHTGGTVIHFYLDGPITAAQAKQIIYVACTKSHSPYFSLSPVNCYCSEHGHLDKTYLRCPKCGKETDIIQRITGYPRKVKFFNAGKYQEFLDRHQLVFDESVNSL
jgi:ribonucleoside-triphosphate reductase